MFTTSAVNFVAPYTQNKNVKWGMTFQASCKWIPWEKQKQSFIVFSKTLPLNFRLKNHNSLPGYYSLQQFIIQYFFIVLHYLVILSFNHINKGDYVKDYSVSTQTIVSLNRVVYNFIDQRDIIYLSIQPPTKCKDNAKMNNKIKIRKEGKDEKNNQGK